MDEWFLDGKEAPPTHPLSFEKADKEMCFNKIRKELVMPAANLHFPKADTRAYRQSWEGVRCAVMQGGQGDIKHWAFNDPPKREGKYKNAPPSPAEYRKLTTRVVDLHPITIAQNARTSGGGNITMVPTRAISVGPVENVAAGGKSFHLAGWHARQSLWPAPHDVHDLGKNSRIAPCRCPCSLIIRTCSLISTARASAPATSRCIKGHPMVNDYQTLIEILKAKGIGAYFQNENLLVISNSNPALPSSNTFKVINLNGSWYLQTWLPATYAIPENQDAAEVCESVYHSSPTAIYNVDEVLEKKFGLHRLNETEAEELGLENF